MSNQALSQIGPLLGKIVPQATNILKGIGNFANKNPELTQKALTALLATGGSTTKDTTAQGGGQDIQSIVSLFQSLSGNSQNKDNKCKECVTLRKKKKSGDALTDEEKLLEEKTCRACEEFCVALDKNPQLGKLDLCDALKALI
jgi:hypothetical protein